MTVLVSIETVLLVLLVVLVAGLLRSHAEILRRLGPGGGAADGGLAVAPPEARDRERRPAPVLSGTTPAGDAVRLDFSRGGGHLTLLAFLTTGCGTCAEFWSALAEPRLPARVETVIVTRGSEGERPAAVHALAPAGMAVVMSTAAWSDYGVPGPPYFVLVERTVLGEGVASTWSALASLVGDAVAEEEGVPAAPAPAGRREPAGAARAREVDAVLVANGIGPDHPSLYPGADPGAPP